MAIYKCPKCEEPTCYTTQDTCKIHNVKAELQRIVSSSTRGTRNPDGDDAEAARRSWMARSRHRGKRGCPQPQTKEHLMALGIIGVDKIVIVQNKIDIVDSKQAEENYRQIERFVKGTVAESARSSRFRPPRCQPRRPPDDDREGHPDPAAGGIEARQDVRRAFLRREPARHSSGEDRRRRAWRESHARSHEGREEIEISPGRQVTLGNKTEWKNITTTIRSLHTGGSGRKEVRPGGLIAIGTNLDPVLTKADGLVGRVVGPPESLPEILMKMSVEVNLLERVVGVPEELKVEGIKTSEPLMVSVGTATTVGVVTSARENEQTWPSRSRSSRSRSEGRRFAAESGASGGSSATACSSEEALSTLVRTLESRSASPSLLGGHGDAARVNAASSAAAVRHRHPDLRSVRARSDFLECTE